MRSPYYNYSNGISLSNKSYWYAWFHLPRVKPKSSLKSNIIYLIKPEQSKYKGAL